VTVVASPASERPDRPGDTGDRPPANDHKSAGRGGSGPGPSLGRRIGRRASRAVAPSLITTYLSLLVLIPIAAVASQAFNGGWSAFTSVITQPLNEQALELTFISALVVVAVNTVAGTMIAWVLVRDEFPGKALLSAIIDLPFALPTVVAGLTLLSLYGPDSPFHVNISGTRIGIWVALAFVTLPFSVRSVQPVLEELDRDAEEAAASLGASSFTVLRRVILPSLGPAMLSGGALGFARALGEYGSLVLIAGDLQVASIRIFDLYETGNTYQPAAAVSLVLLVMSLAVLLIIGGLRRHLLRDEVSP
jgi:sulfate transport system permease protein